MVCLLTCGVLAVSWPSCSLESQFSLEKTSKNSLLVSWRSSVHRRSTSLRRVHGESFSLIQWANLALLFRPKDADADHHPRRSCKSSSVKMSHSLISWPAASDGIRTDA